MKGRGNVRVICGKTILNFVFAPISAMKHILRDLQQSLRVSQKALKKGHFYHPGLFLSSFT